MGQSYAVVGSGVLLLSYCAYCEAWDALQSTARPISSGRAKIAGYFAACLTLIIGFVVCCLLAAGNPYDGAL
jgi:hypothetical protein